MLPDLCGDLCGDEVACRVWIYNGEEYNVPPKAMIIDAILREIYSNNGSSDNNEDKNEQKYELPRNLQKFFEFMRKNNVTL
jgi:hypothetical protein